MWNTYRPWHIIEFIAGALGVMVLLLIAGALIFVLVRFLLVATKAAKIYVAKNSPVVTSVATTPMSTTAAAETTPVATTPTTVTKPPATKPRTPKTPPAV